MFWGFTEKPSFRGGFSKSQYKGGIDYRGWFWQFTGLRGAWKETRGGVFEGVDGRVDTPVHTLNLSGDGEGERGKNEKEKVPTIIIEYNVW